ncbi:UDP-glycosyltransferase, partial [Ladona fulva]
YHENMMAIKSLVNDQKEHPLDRAVYWIEYVLRHKGSRHMQLASVDLAWYQLYVLDVLFVLIVIPIFTLLFISYAVIKILKKVCKSKRKTSDTSKKNQ